MQAFNLDTISPKRNTKEFQILKKKDPFMSFFLDQICPFSSNNFTDRLVSSNTDWPVTVLPCYIP